jgi:hypothetical protein
MHDYGSVVGNATEEHTTELPCCVRKLCKRTRTGLEQHSATPTVPCTSGWTSQGSYSSRALFLRVLSGPKNDIGTPPLRSFNLQPSSDCENQRDAYRSN